VRRTSSGSALITIGPAPNLFRRTSITSTTKIHVRLTITTQPSPTIEQRPGVVLSLPDLDEHQLPLGSLVTRVLYREQSALGRLEEFRPADNATTVFIVEYVSNRPNCLNVWAMRTPMLVNQPNHRTHFAWDHSIVCCPNVPAHLLVRGNCDARDVSVDSGTHSAARSRTAQRQPRSHMGHKQAI
jgi:hypothetical protein